MNPAAPHHDGSPLYVSTSTPALGDTVRVRVRIPDSWEVAAVRTRSNPDHEPRWSDAEHTGTIDGWAWWEADVVVQNPRHGYRFLILTTDGGIHWLSQAGLSRTETLDADDFALVASDDAPPSWMPDAVMYQIFPDRFGRSAAADARPTPEWAIPAAWDDPVDPAMPGRSQQFYGGDLDGVIEHLDHLVDLGVTLLYLTPVFPGGSNHRYDASSFTVVDPLLGGDEALIRLVDAAHARGLKIIGDLTSNHSGDRHEWFQAALGHPEAPESAFYYFLDAGNRTYESWLGTATLPKFDWSSAELRRRFIEGPDSVVAKWLKPPYSFDGWRIDVANMTARLGSIDLNAEVRQTIRRTMLDINPDTILLAESTNDATSDVQGDAWHGAMTYTDFTRPVWGWLSDGMGPAWVDSDGTEHTVPWFFGQPIGGIPDYTGGDLVEAYTRFTAGIPWRTRLGTMHPLDTHDTARFRTHAKPGAVPLAVGLSMTLPGIPVVWAGDEFGLTGGDGENSRTPLPWSRIDESAETIGLYRDLIGLRREHPVLATGGLRWLHVSDDALVFVRESDDESVLVLARRAGSYVPDTVGAPLLGEVPTTGPAFAAWTLPGVGAPAWRAAS